VGRDSWRPYYNGKLMIVSSDCDEITNSTRFASRDFTEPYDVAFSRSSIFVTTGNGVSELDFALKERRTWSCDWFAQIHAIDISSDERRLLVTSSGFDGLLEFDVESQQRRWEWFAFDHMNYESTTSYCVTGSEADAIRRKRSGHSAVVVDEPRKWGGYGLPTRYRLHLNDARYSDPDRILITMAHLGACFTINRSSASAVPLLTGLQAPHGLVNLPGGGLCVADTRRGRILILGEGGAVKRAIYFQGLPGLTDRRRDGFEWIQNVASMAPNVLFDGGRDCIWLIDIVRRTYRGIKTPSDWRIHRALTVPAFAGLGGSN
jgi:hypothetical protein